MILDRLSNADQYTILHPGLSPGFAWLRGALAEPPELGRHPLDGDRLFVIVADEVGRGHDRAKLEVHRRYIDIQMTLPSPGRATTGAHEAQDIIGWRALADCSAPEADFKADRDIQFFRDRPETWLALPPGVFAIFYPTDAHAPLAGAGPVRKAVVKVALDW